MEAHRRAVFLGTGAVLAVGALVAVAWVAGYQDCWAALRQARWKPLAFAPLVLIASHVGYTVSYRAVAKVADGPCLGARDATALVVAGFGPFNPRGGFAVDALGLAGHGMDRSRTTLRVLVLGALEYAVLAPMAWIAALWMVGSHLKVQDGLLPSWTIGVPAGGLLTLAAWLIYRGLRRRRRSTRGDARGFSAIGITLRMAVSWPGGTLAWVGMAVYWVGEIALLGICMAAFGHHNTSAAAVTLAYATGYALTRRTLPLAGAGPVEAILPFALAWVSYPLATAVVAVAAYRVFNLWLTIPPTAVALRRLRRMPGLSTQPERMAEKRGPVPAAGA